MQNTLNKKLYLAIFFSGLLLLSAVVKANTCNEGIGGTGNSINSEGFGGTGISAKNDGYGGTGITADGYGGTGITAKNDGFGGTGIVGVITGFASVCVNGVEAHFDSNTLVDVDGTSSSIDKLKIGDLVAIKAKGQGAEVSAESISVVHAIVGPIDSINTTQHQLNVMGQQVSYTPITLGVNTLKVGQKVAVSGFLASNGSIQAMRVDQVNNNTPSLISGTLINGKVLGKQINTSHNQLNGSNVQVFGNWDGKIFTAIDVKQNAMDRVMRPGYAINAQGTIYQSAGTQSLYAIGKEVNINSNTRVYGNKNLPNSLVIVRGKLDSNGRVEVKEIEYQPFERTLERGGSKDRVQTIRDKNKSSINLDNESKLQKNIDRDQTRLQKLNENEKPEKTEPSGKIKKLEKIDKPEQLDKVDKPEKVDKVDKVERVEKVEVPERIEAPEKPERYTY